VWLITNIFYIVLAISIGSTPSYAKNDTKDIGVEQIKQKDGDKKQSSADDGKQAITKGKKPKYKKAKKVKKVKKEEIITNKKNIN